MNSYQWTVLFAAWLGWGFDVFDGLLFNYLAQLRPNAARTRDRDSGSPCGNASIHGDRHFRSAGRWAIGGILFGKVCDRIGRTRTLLVTMAMYAVGTALCAIAPNIELLILFRVVASLGIGEEWAAGASMVAEEAAAFSPRDLRPR